MSKTVLAALVKEALTSSSNKFVKTAEKTTDLLRNEKGRIGRLTFTSRLAQLDPYGVALVIGDLHGDLQSLTTILQKSRFIEKMAETKDSVLIFLGDYGDRGNYSAEVYYVILNLKLAFPGQIVLLRGNHEAPKDLLGYPHDLPIHFKNRFGEGWDAAYEKTRALWDYLYNAVYVEHRYLMVHGGISPQISNLQDIAQAQSNHGAVLEDLLWSDPEENMQGISSSPRGAGKLFGKDVTENTLAKLNAKIFIRGHESCEEGFRLNHNAKVLTLFSSKSFPYINKYAAYMELPLSLKFENGWQLIRFINKF